MSRTFKDALRAGPVLGTWSMLGSATAAEAVAASGIDYVVIDLEHGVFGWDTLADVVRAVQVGGAAAIIRSGSPRHDDLLRMLESKPDGIMVSHCCSAKEAAAIVDAVLYPPLGSRGISPYTRTHAYSHEGLAHSTQRTNDELMVGVLLEGEEGVAACEEVSAVPGIDLIYFGIYDFAQSQGFGADLDRPEIQGAMAKIAGICDAQGVSCGTFAQTVEQARRYADAGIRFVALGCDGMMLESGYRAQSAEFRDGR